jgi:rRNA maturation protein Nop10
MNLRCTICDAVLAYRPGGDHCPECGARAVFLVPTKDSPRHAKGAGTNVPHAWDMDPDGPILRRQA